MPKPKGKRGGGTRISLEHGVQSSRLHWIHAQASKERQQIVFVAHAVVDGTDYRKFQSDVSGLGSGRNWLRCGDDLEITDGKEWLDKMLEVMEDCSWFHRRTRETIKKGKHKGLTKIRYPRRKMEDRKQLGATDRRGRPDTDLMRETIDLRPDHSKVLQYLIEDGRKKDLFPLLAAVQKEQIRLFEEIYKGRKVVAEGEHVDSGQYHFDHWHTGINEEDVSDHGAVVKIEQGNEILKVKGANEKFRIRAEFRSFGVGDGMASFDRHRSALEENGHDAKKIMGYTHDRLLQNTESTQKQNKEFPRDLRMWRAVDEFVGDKLRELDPDLYDKALSEYAEWIEAGYELGKLGVKEETLAESKHKQRKAELEGLKAIIRFFVEFMMKIPGVMQVLKADDQVWGRFEEMLKLIEPEKDPNEEPKKTRAKNRAGQSPSMGGPQI